MRERGQSIVELALALPILLIVLLGLLDLGRAYYVLVALEDMAAEGATYAAIHPGDVAEIQTRTAAASSGLVEVDTSAVLFECPTCAGGPSGGDSVTVTVPYTFTFVTPFASLFVEDGWIELRGTATGVVISD
jgi:Flp pilus assembly protein TadG